MQLSNAKLNLLLSAAIVLGVGLLVTAGVLWHRQKKESDRMRPVKVEIASQFSDKIVYTLETGREREPYVRDCRKRKGEFNECGSPCGPSAEACIQACAFTCEFRRADAETPPAAHDTFEKSVRVETRIHEGASALDVKVVPLEVLEDSRCPLGVNCIQAGTVRLRAQLSSGLGTGEEDFALGMPITTEAEEVELVEVLPVPSQGITPSDYRFIFEIRKRTDV